MKDLIPRRESRGLRREMPNAGIDDQDAPWDCDADQLEWWV